MKIWLVEAYQNEGESASDWHLLKKVGIFTSLDLAKQAVLDFSKSYLVHYREKSFKKPLWKEYKSSKLWNVYFIADISVRIIRFDLDEANTDCSYL